LPYDLVFLQNAAGATRPVRKLFSAGLRNLGGESSSSLIQDVLCS